MSNFEIGTFTPLKTDVEEFESLSSCRTCKSTSSEFQYIFSYPDVKFDSPLKLADMLMECTSIQVLIDDGLPTVICPKCINQLINAYNFKKQCEKVDILFRNNIKQTQGIKVDHFLASPASVDGLPDNFHDDDESDDEKPLAYLAVDQNIENHRPVDYCLSKRKKNQNCNKSKKISVVSENNSSLPVVENTTVQPGVCLKDLDLSKTNQDDYDFQCKICHKILETVGTIRQHMGVHLKRKLYTCEACTMVFVRANSLEQHVGQGRCRGKPVIWCPKCVKIFRTEELLKIHRMEKDRCKNDVKVCLESVDDVEEYIFAIEKKKKKKKSGSQGENDAEIPLVGQNVEKKKSDDEDSSFEPETSIDAEDDGNPNKKMTSWYCKGCGKTLSIGTSKKKHAKSCATRHICEICNESFNLKLNLKKHKRVVHQIRSLKQYSCSVCSKMFTKSRNRDHHEKVHRKRLKCKACDTLFETSDELKTHYKENENCEKRHLCPECGRRFREKFLLDCHLRRHTGEKPYKCKLCEKAFTASMELNKHMKSHIGERKHLCTYCGKGFKRLYLLKSHTRIHTGELPYQCEFCPRRFRTKCDYRVHRRVHTCERFFCDICDAAFLTNSYLLQHKRRKHGLAIPRPEPGIPLLNASDPRQPVKPEIRGPVVEVRYRAPNKNNQNIIVNNPIFTYDPAAYRQ